MPILGRMTHKKDITVGAINFSVEWRVNWGYHVFAHCPTCGSSFNSADDTDEWHHDLKVAMANASNGLAEHTVKHHSPKHGRTNAPS